MFRFSRISVGILLLLSQSMTVANLSTDSKRLKITSSGGFYNCGLEKNGKIYCWGFNSLGSLGNDSNEDSEIPVSVSIPENGDLHAFTSISSGNNSSCGLTLVGVAYCWGDNRNGVLGNGMSNTPSKIPVAVAAPKGDSILTFSSISVGGGFASEHVCGLTLKGKAYCWGSNKHGELGNPSVLSSNVPLAVVTPQNGKSLMFSSISSGGTNFTCALTAMGKVYCWGSLIKEIRSNISLGNFSMPEPLKIQRNGQILNFSSISAGGEHICGLVKGKAYCWGSNHFGQLGNNSLKDSGFPIPVAAPKGKKSITFTSITSGYEHTCALTSSGEAYCWGFNKTGELGNNTIKQSKIPVAVAAPIGEKKLSFSSISAGGSTCGIALSGKAYCWGDNSFGQLGNNSKVNSSIPVLVAPLP
jgi:alpha-tubulin suppressor-like RCC1 family protein